MKSETVNEVPRDLLERIYRHLFVEPALNRDDSKKLRALLDAPSAQEQGDPIYQLEYLGEGGGGWNDVDKDTYQRFERLPNYRPRIVYAEQPAPSARAGGVVMVDGVACHDAVACGVLDAIEAAGYHWDVKS